MRLVVVVLCFMAFGCGGGDGPGGGGDGDGDGDGDELRSVAVDLRVVEQHATDPELRNGSVDALVNLNYDAVGNCQVVFSTDENPLGCTVYGPVVPACEPACGDDEMCAFDRECDAICVPACTLECGTGEYCHRSGDGPMSCEPREPYEAAGSIAFSGLSQPVTLEGPSYVPAIIEGDVFTSGPVTASADGATNAGVTPFELEVDPPLDMVATPPLSSLTQEDFADDLVLFFNAGSDDIDVEIFAGERRIVCHYDDAGDVRVPKSVLDTIPDSATAVRIDLERIREEIVSLSGFGSYLGNDVPEPGRAVLELVSLETATIPFQ